MAKRVLPDYLKDALAGLTIPRGSAPTSEEVNADLQEKEEAIQRFLSEGEKQEEKLYTQSDVDKLLLQKDRKIERDSWAYQFCIEVLEIIRKKDKDLFCDAVGQVLSSVNTPKTEFSTSGNTYSDVTYLRFDLVNRGNKNRLGGKYNAYLTYNGGNIATVNMLNENQQFDNSYSAHISYIIEQVFEGNLVLKNTKELKGWSGFKRDEIKAVLD